MVPTRKRHHSEPTYGRAQLGEGERASKRARTLERDNETDDTETQPHLVYREMENYTSKYPRYYTYNHVSKFVMRSVSADPEGDLKMIFTQIIDRAIKNTPGVVSKYSVLIFADGLTNPINIPMRAPDQNTPEVSL